MQHITAREGECNDDFDATQYQPLAVYWTNAGHLIVKRQAWHDHDCAVSQLSTDGQLPDRGGR